MATPEQRTEAGRVAAAARWGPAGLGAPARGPCTIDGCEAPVVARGWCNAHYKRWRRTGHPERPMDVGVRFWSKVDRRGPDECWQWLAGPYGDRVYGNFRTYYRQWPAHRFAYEYLVGPIPDGLQIDHLCMNLRCVNPAHMEPVNLEENVRRWHQAGRPRPARLIA